MKLAALRWGDPDSAQGECSMSQPVTTQAEALETLLGELGEGVVCGCMGNSSEEIIAGSRPRLAHL